MLPGRRSVIRNALNACDSILTVDKAAALLRQGEVVIFPTETVYGLGAAISRPEAVARVFAAKERPQFNPLIVHISGRGELDPWVTAVPPAAEALMQRFWPGPLTFLLPKRETVSDLITAGCPEVAVRLPAHGLARDLIRATGVPLAAPSANFAGQLSPTRLEDLDPRLLARVAGVVPGAPSEVGLESTVIRVCEDRIELLRPGGLSVEALQAASRLPVMALTAMADGATGAASPGTQASHYAPETPLTLFPTGELPLFPAEPFGLFLFGPPTHPLPARTVVEVLSERRDLTEAAHHFFSALKRLDRRGLTRIFAERLPPEGLGMAMNDRLQRAALAHP